MKNNLFVRQDFTSHSGVQLNWKIECDALTKEELDALAQMVSHNIHYKKAYGVPRGGLLFAEYLNKYADCESTQYLIVDDVLTTGASMIEMREKLNPSGDLELQNNLIGVVIFARMNPSPWIRPIFTLGGYFR